jgi:type I restriction enzyme S subunit
MSDKVPNGWKECRLEEVAKIVGGGTPKTDVDEYWNGDIPWITPKDLSNFSGRYISKGERNISEKGLVNSSAKLLPPGTILLTSRAPVGYLAIAENEITTNQGFRSLVPLNNIDNIFLFYLLKNNIEYLKSQATGTTFGELAGSVLKSLVFLFPPLPEQRAIASVLSSLDDKIDLLHRENKTLEAMAETLFRQWFVEEAKDEWEEVPLSEVTKIAIGRTPPRKESHWFSTDPKDVKWVSIKDLGQSEVFVFDTSEYLKQEAVENFNIPIIPADTVLLSFKMTVGRVGITTEPMVSNEAIAHFKFDDNTPFSKEYLYIFLKTFKYESLGSTSSIVTAINSSMIKDIEIIIPDDITMNVFRTYTEPLFSKIKANIYQIRTLEKLRNTLLPKLMSGEVRIQY